MTLSKMAFCDYQLNGNLVILVTRAKLNFTYRRRKNWERKQTSRIRGFDLSKYEEFSNENNFNIGYDEKTNDFWVELRDIQGPVIKISGWNTGGQLIRSILQIAANSGIGKTEAPLKLELEPFTQTEKQANDNRNGKSSMLQGTQTRIWTMSPGDVFEFTGGDSTNTDALHWERHSDLFDLFREVLGYNFTLENKNTNLSESDNFVLTRLDDVTPKTSEITTNAHFADQIMMGVIINHCKQIYKSGGADEDYIPRSVTIRYPSGIDFHPDAMIKLARALQIPVIDNKPEPPQKLPDETEMALETRHIEIVREWIKLNPERVTKFW